MAVSVDKERPHGWLGKLYDQAKSYNRHPIYELERITEQAFSDGVIDNRRYTVVQYRVSLPGYERETLKQVSIRLGTKIGTNVLNLEFDIYQSYQEYLPEEVRGLIVASNSLEDITELKHQILNVDEVSLMLRVHSNSVRRWSDLGILHAFRVGVRGDRRFKMEDIKAYIESTKTS